MGDWPNVFNLSFLVALVCQLSSMQKKGALHTGFLQIHSVDPKTDLS